MLVPKKPLRSFMKMFKGGTADSDRRINKWTDDILKHIAHMLELVHKPTLPYCKTYAVIQEIKTINMVVTGGGGKQSVATYIPAILVFLWPVGFLVFSMYGMPLILNTLVQFKFANILEMMSSKFNKN